MEFLTYKIHELIDEMSVEYKSMMDMKKPYNFSYLYEYFLSFIPQSKKQNKNIDFHPSARIFNIPVTTPIVHTTRNATIGFDGGIFFNGKYFQNILDKKIFEQRFAFIEKLSLFNIRSLEDLKKYVKKFYYKHISLHSYCKRKILNNPHIVKIVFFGTAYENMYHFIFQYYPNITPLIAYCNQNQLDFYIVMPAKCNRKKQMQSCYRNYIDELMNLQGVPKNKMIFLDYQNYNAKNIIYTDSPIDSPKIVLSTMNKIQKAFYKNTFSTPCKRLYISRKKATHRFLTNETEIRKILEEEYGFLTVYMEDYNLKEKVNIMAHIDTIISVDGTSLVNGYFSQEQEVKLIGIRSFEFSEYNAITSSIFKNISYLPIVASTVQVINGDGPNWLKDDLYLDPNYLKEKLEQYNVSPYNNLYVDNRKNENN